MSSILVRCFNNNNSYKIKIFMDIGLCNTECLLEKKGQFFGLKWKRQSQKDSLEQSEMPVKY